MRFRSRRALAAMRVRVPVLHVAVSYPLDEEIVRSFAAGRRRVYVVEEPGPFVEEGVRGALLGSGVEGVWGKADESGERFIPAHSELEPGRRAEGRRAGDAGGSARPGAKGGWKKSGGRDSIAGSACSIAGLELSSRALYAAASACVRLKPGSSSVTARATVEVSIGPVPSSPTLP